MIINNNRICFSRFFFFSLKFSQYFNVSSRNNFIVSTSDIFNLMNINQFYQKSFHPFSKSFLQYVLEQCCQLYMGFWYLAILQKHCYLSWHNMLLIILLFCSNFLNTKIQKQIINEINDFRRDWRHLENSLRSLYYFKIFPEIELKLRSRISVLDFCKICISVKGIYGIWRIFFSLSLHSGKEWLFINNNENFFVIVLAYE